MSTYGMGTEASDKERSRGSHRGIQVVSARLRRGRIDMPYAKGERDCSAGESNSYGKGLHMGNQLVSAELRQGRIDMPHAEGEWVCN